MGVDIDFPVHYRYRDSVSEDGFFIDVMRFYPIRETKCFYIVISEWDKKFLYGKCGSKVKERRVRKGSVRSYCFPSKEKALYAYKKRKESQLFHSELSLKKARSALSAVSGVAKPTDSIKCESDEILESYIFD